MRSYLHLPGLSLAGVLLVFLSLVRGGTEDLSRDKPPSGTIRLAQNSPASSTNPPAANPFLAATKRSSFKPPRIRPEDLLASGDQQVLVTLKGTPRPAPQKQWLVRLEKTWALLRENPAKEPTLTTAASNSIVEIATADGKFRWKLGPDGKAFVGPVQPSPATEELRFESQPASRRQLEQFLLLSFRRLMNRALDGVTGSPSPLDVAEVRWIAGKRSKEIGRQDLNRAIAELYAMLPGTLDTVAAQVKIQDQLISEYNKTINVLVTERKKIADRQAMAGMVGFAKMFMGAMPDQDVVRGSFGQTYVIDRGPISPELMASGLRDLTDASRAGAAHQGMLNTLKELADDKQRKAMEESLGVQMEAIAGLRSRFDEVAIREYRLLDAAPIPPEEWSKPRRKTADYQPLIDRLTQRCEQEKEALGRDNPFAQVDLVFFKSLVPLPLLRDRINTWQEEARETVKLAGGFPNDPLFDSDRADLLTTAGELAIRAAETEIGSARWADAYHPRGEFANKALDLALKYFPEDPLGRAREQKAQALLLSGRVDDALKLAREVSGVRSESARFRFQLARIECAAGQPEKGLDDLEAAIVRLGFPDIEEARRRGGDFPQADPRYRELTEIRLAIDGGQRRGFGATPGVVVTNRSRFALTDVTVDLQYEAFAGRGGIGAKAKTVKQQLRQPVVKLEPGESVVVRPGQGVRAKYSNQGVLQGTLAVVSRQGKSKIYTSK